jgi:hypothetical protein
MNAEIFREGKWLDMIQFGHYEVYNSGRVQLNGVTFVKSFDGSPGTDTVLLPADVTLYIKERD